MRLSLNKLDIHLHYDTGMHCYILTTKSCSLSQDALGSNANEAKIGIRNIFWLILCLWHDTVTHKSCSPLHTGKPQFYAKPTPKVHIASKLRCGLNNKVFVYYKGLSLLWTFWCLMKQYLLPKYFPHLLHKKAFLQCGLCGAEQVYPWGWRLPTFIILKGSFLQFGFSVLKISFVNGGHPTFITLIQGLSPSWTF